jgi:mycothiol synthase
MSEYRLITEKIDVERLTTAQWSALTAFENRIRAEMWPDEPPRTVEAQITRMQSVPPFVQLCQWSVRPSSEDRIVAEGHVVTYDHDDNQHVADYDISVLPENRRQGIAKGLLARVTTVAHERNRRLLITSTDSRVPSGEAFMRRIGADAALVEQTNRLDLAELDRELIDAWQRRATERASDFELGLWENPFPEEDLDAIIEMLKVMNTAPRGDLDVEDFTWTKEIVRQGDHSLAQRKIERWTLYARHKETHDLAGYTDVFWDPDNPENLDQGDTAVFPRYRNRGIGRWLKAAMLVKILRDRPQATRIYTGNANSNAPMLKINHELGFRLYKTRTVWQISVDKVDAYLGGA